MLLSLNLNGRLMPLDRPRIMGIVNLTADSFYDGGRYLKEADFIQRAQACIREGADILDLGAQSTRPGAAEVGAEEEWNQLRPRLEWLVKHHPEVPVSVDTYHASVAEKAAGAGAAMINDISGGTFDPEMFSVMARIRLPYVLMHTPGRPENMQNQTGYKNVVTEVTSHLARRLRQLLDLGLNDVVIDPGFGFGKTREQNYRLFAALPHFVQTFNRPVVVGISRKSMVYGLLGKGAEEALEGSTALHALALSAGAHLLRVHDVAAAADVVKVVTSVQNPANALS